MFLMHERKAVGLACAQNPVVVAGGFPGRPGVRGPQPPVFREEGSEVLNAVVYNFETSDLTFKGAPGKSIGVSFHLQWFR